MSKFDTYIPGADCSCEARYESECACDADWTPREVYKLREELAAERALADQLAKALELAPCTSRAFEDMKLPAIYNWREARK
jgi:hypothetical protein